MNAGRDNLRKLLAGIVAGAVILSLAIWLGRAIFGTSQKAGVPIVIKTSGPARPTLSDGTVMKAVDMPTALLFDCYEHALENVPPRTDTSKRAWSWEAPGRPSSMFSDSGASEAIDALQNWVRSWEDGWRGGFSPTHDDLTRLTKLLSSSTLPARYLLSVAAAVAFLDESVHAVIWYRAGINRADIETQSIGRHDPPAADYVRLLAQTGLLWREKEHAALLQRYMIERRLGEPATSVSFRKATHLASEMLYLLGRTDEALRLIDSLKQAHASAGDLSKDDLVELAWVDGAYSYYSGDMSRAVVSLPTAARARSFVQARTAWKLWIAALARTGRADEARQRLEEYRLAYQPLGTELRQLEHVLQASADAIRR